MRCITLTSPSSVGKDTILNAVLKINNKVKPIISSTSRPMRVGEIDGVTYNFVSDNKAKKMLKDGQFIENRIYKVTNNEEWIYGITKDSIDINSDNIYIVIVDFQGLESLEEYLNQYDIEVESIYIQCNAQERLRRSINREGQMDDKQVKEVCRRLLDDEKNVVQAKHYCSYILINETQDDFVECISRINKLIGE